MDALGKVYGAILDQRTRANAESPLNENGVFVQWVTEDQIFCMRQSIEKLHGREKDLNVCFIDLQKE